MPRALKSRARNVLIAACVAYSALLLTQLDRVTLETQVVLPLGTRLLELAGYPPLATLDNLDPVADPDAYAAQAARVSAMFEFSTRLFNAQMAGDAGHVVQIRDAIAVRVYRGSTDPPAPGPAGRAAFYFHGGGFTIGSAALLQSFAGWLRPLLNVSAIIAVDYRLAPTHPFPAAVHDCAAAVAHVFDHASDFNVDPQNFVFFGESAGGNLVLTVMLHLRRTRLDVFHAVSHLAPIYPTVDANCMGCYPSVRYFGEGHLLTAVGMHTFMAAYLKGDRAAAQSDLASPIYAPPAELAQFPPTFISTASHDVLRDEGVAMAHTLLAAGVWVVSKTYEQTLHNFAMGPGIHPQAKQMWQDIADFVAL